MSDFQNLGLGAAAGSLVSGFFVWLSKRSSIKAATMGREDAELKNYRKELRDDLEAARRALDEVKADRILLMERAAVERIKLEERVAHLEHEKSSCLDQIKGMERRIGELQAEIAALRGMVLERQGPTERR